MTFRTQTARPCVSACETLLKRLRPAGNFRFAALTLALLLGVLYVPGVSGQGEPTHPPVGAAAPAVEAAHDAQPATTPHAAEDHSEQGDAAHGEGAHGEGEAHAESPWATVARIFNFLLLAGGLAYVLRGPLSQHFANRRQHISGDLIAARETTNRATAQLEEIDRRLKALPAELEELRRRGAQEIAGEEARIRQQAEAERQRLLEQSRREIDLQVRLARRELARYAADLSVKLAADRLGAVMQEDDHARLVDRYVSQVKEMHG